MKQAGFCSISGTPEKVSRKLEMSEQDTLKPASGEAFSPEELGQFAGAYFRAYGEAVTAIDKGALAEASRMLWSAYANDRLVFICGNGGSAGISNHGTCDQMKRPEAPGAPKPRVVSLASSPETMTMIANDYGYEEVFRYQLQGLARAGDMLITISSSGNSENIVRALEWAKENGLPTVALTGFSGGRSAKMADVNIHVPSENYGIIEDAHQSIMHIFAQYIHHVSRRGG